MADENQEAPAVETPVDTTPTTEVPAVETPETGGESYDRTPASANPALEAFDKGLEQVPQRTKEEADKAAAKVEGEEGAEAGKDDEKDGADDAAEAGDKDADEKGKKELDHINDPIPQELKEATRERITSLVGMVKERDKALETQGILVSAVEATGASPQEFAQMVGYMKAVHSQNPQDLEAAYTMLKGELRGLALRLGRDIPEVDALEGYDDLKNAVRYGQITKEHASEVARARTWQKEQTAARERQQTTTATTERQTAERNSAITELNQLGESLAKSDPDYQRKYDLIVEPLKAAFEGLPPSQWKNAFSKAYAALKLPAVPVAAAPVAGAPPPGMVRDPKSGQFVKKQTPLRPTNPAGSTTGAPKSMRDALSSAIDNLR